MLVCMSRGPPPYAGDLFFGALLPLPFLNADSMPSVTKEKVVPPFIQAVSGIKG
mgnify:CR=1 FL=1